ncbi:MAG: hypothetical protein CL769_02990 [Chloroflexi bacterium]|nr:hypothetical protein [Chloroflexota bacterium]
MPTLSNIIIFLTISTLMISISMIFRNAGKRNLSKFNQSNSLFLLMFSIITGLFIIMLAKF